MASLEKLDYPDYEVLIVDNGSTDDSVEQLRTHYPHHTLLELKENFGYAGGGVDARSGRCYHLGMGKPSGY